MRLRKKSHKADHRVGGNFKIMKYKDDLIINVKNYTQLLQGLYGEKGSKGSNWEDKNNFLKIRFSQESICCRKSC